MVTKEVTILNETGLHARPAQLFVQKAGEFQSEIKIKKEDGSAADAKSILGLMSLGLTKGTKITIEASGDDAEQAAAALVRLVEEKFGES
ncbi:Phosphotransferase system, phosphocarrier protein HPr [Desulfotomaculum nigrificans CO-1-SRB]|uniref:Phosphotransferase system, phosphocarrier protein HPr n=1 Tax=Desulfotomaculum nigrificans (strain DSM 14880 / VKM B-2319 / CO-1-SRB) TaxID=868595 RepID=F6B693_DESCC|nr:HPr family phosphocarrier protein [Desulfotomaculum nigrificans]AEF95516.1 Phosphotransferase system, phosphocarrier protein HPr [Desulfotomaculum nigrificans CO-1-SRB]